MPHVSLETVLNRTAHVIRNTMGAHHCQPILESLTIATMGELLAAANALNPETAQRWRNRAGLNAPERRVLRRLIIRSWSHALNTGRIVPILIHHAKHGS